MSPEFEDFFGWFAENDGKDLPQGTQVDATADYEARQIIVTYEHDGVPVRSVYNVDVNLDTRQMTYEEVGKMPRNEFEQNVPIEPEEDKEVPLTLGVGGPVVGTAKVTKDGVVIGEITDDNLRKKLQGDVGQFAIGRDPADKYRSNDGIDYSVFEQ